MTEFEILLSRYESLLLNCERMEKTSFQAQEMAREIAAKLDGSQGEKQFAEENERALRHLSMALGNPCLECNDDTGLAGALVRYVLDRLKRAEADIEDIRG